MGPSPTVDLAVRTDGDGALFARGVVGGQSVLVTVGTGGLVGADVDVVVPVGRSNAAGPTTVAEGESRRVGGVDVQHAHRRVDVADAEGRWATLDASATTPAVGLQVRRADGGFDHHVGRVDDDPRRLLFGADGASYRRVGRRRADGDDL